MITLGINIKYGRLLHRDWVSIDALIHILFFFFLKQFRSIQGIWVQDIHIKLGGDAI